MQVFTAITIAKLLESGWIEKETTQIGADLDLPGRGTGASDERETGRFGPIPQGIVAILP